MWNVIRFLKLFGAPIGLLLTGLAVYAAQSYTVSVGSGVKINEHGQCRYAENTSAAATIFISTNSPAEWTSFYSNTIPGVSWNSCCAVDYYRPATTCVAVGNGYYAAANDEVRYACTNQPANTVGVTYSGPGGGVNNCPYSAVTCVTDYRRQTATSCTACTSGQYNPNANTSATCSTCTNVPAGAQSATYTGTGGGTNNCPYSAVTCLADYRRPSVTTCNACTSGQYNPAGNTNTTCSNCTNLPANAFSAVYSGTGGGANNCPYSSVTCNGSYYRNTMTSCAICSNGRYSADGNTASAATCTGACTNTVAGSASVTYSGPGTSSTSCPIGSVTCATDYSRPTATTCSACTAGQYNPNGNTNATCSSCTNLPANAFSAVYSGTGGGTNNCPYSSVTCNADYYRNTTTSCAGCGTGTYTAANNTAASCTACTNKPANSSYSGTGGGSNNCPWTCNSGYSPSGGTCVPTCTAVPKYVSCFTAGTKVLMADGSEKSIEQIKVGESVLTYDEKLGFKTMSKVTEALHHPARMQPMYTFVFENGSQFTVTAEHLIYSYEAQTYLPAAKLARTFRQGHDVYLMNTSSTPTRVRTVTMKNESVPTYNLHVEGLDTDMSEAGRGHNYFASSQLVHNAKMCNDGSSQPPITEQQAVNCVTTSITQHWDTCYETYYDSCGDTTGCP